MSKCTKNWIIILVIVLLLTPIGFYLLKFSSGHLSSDTETWGQFGDYLNGTFMPMIALIGIIITYYLGMISEARNEANLKLDQQKHRPLLHVGYFDKETEIEIFMINKGSGPLIITNYKLVHLDETERASIYDILPDDEAIYNNYSGNLDNVVLSSQEKFELLKYNPSSYAEGYGYNDNTMIEIRKALCKYKIVIEYCDVYNNKMPTYERSFSWFGR